MSDALKNPDMPPGALVETFDDGSALRNDGVKLTPANKNPWYLLATVAGEQGDFELDVDLHARNRRFWNGWMCQNMSGDERKAIASKLNLPETELAPLSDEEYQQVKACFKAAFPDKSSYDMVPNPSQNIDFRHVYLSRSLSLCQCFIKGKAFFHKTNFASLANFEQAYFNGVASFHEAHFISLAVFKKAQIVGNANFQESYFGGVANFENIHFTETAKFKKTYFARLALFQEAQFINGASFSKAHFSEDTDFKNAHFSQTAKFEKVNFTKRALFQGVFFASSAEFKEANFANDAVFSNGAFKATTLFHGATFKTRVPKFYQREMHQDTNFSDAAKHWPQVTPDNAEESKQAYTRLRQVAADNHNPDLEHFFLRQEMRCKEALAKTFVDRLLFKGYRWLADSGISVVRPATGLALIWLIPGFAYLLRYLYLHRNAEKIIAANSELPALADLSVLGSFGLSFANLFAFLGLNRLYFQEVIAELNPWLSLLAGFQTISGVVLLFFLGLGLRNRFRLK